MAREGIERMVATMIEAALTAENATTGGSAQAGFGGAVQQRPEMQFILHENIFEAARMRFCPCYPFC